MENITKSIIYGNAYQNKYGKFLPLCSSINDRASIHNILDYLHSTPHFKKYNRIAYAYRVEQVPVVFITQKKNIQLQHYDGKHSDQTIEGSGDKLLHLLQKFNIKNVFIGILIQQFNPLMPFQTTNYRAIVENCRLLLEQLYKKVASLQDKVQIKSYNDLLLHSNQNVKLKRNNITQNIQIPSLNKKIQNKERPNHIYSQSKPQFIKNKISQPTSTAYQIKFLWERCKQAKQQYQQCLQSMEQNQLEQMKYYALSEKNSLINFITKLLKIFLNLDNNFNFAQYDFSLLKHIKFQAIQDKILKKLQDQIKANKRLSIQTVMKQNRPMGMILNIIQLKIKLSKMLIRIRQLMNKTSFSNKQGQNQSVKRKSNVQILDEQNGNNFKFVQSGIKINKI